jgi:hypothetical protein
MAVLLDADGRVASGVAAGADAVLTLAQPPSKGVGYLVTALKASTWPFPYHELWPEAPVAGGTILLGRRLRR